MSWLALKNLLCYTKGCTQLFAALIANHVSASKINFFGALAPVAHLKHTGSLLLEACADTHAAGALSDLGVGEFLPSNGL